MLRRDLEDTAGYNEATALRLVAAIHCIVMDRTFFLSINKHLSNAHGTLSWEYKINMIEFVPLKT